MKRSLEVLREKLASNGWNKEAGRVSTLIKWAEEILESGKIYSLLDGKVTVLYDASNGASFNVKSSDKINDYEIGKTYQQGADGDEGKKFDILFSLAKKSIQKTP